MDLYAGTYRNLCNTHDIHYATFVFMVVAVACISKESQ